MKYVAAILTIMLLAPGLALADNNSDAQADAYLEWANSYYHLGIRPTDEEISAKANQLGIAFLVPDLRQRNDGDYASKQIANSEHIMEICEGVAKSMLESKSETSRTMAKKLQKLVQNIRVQKEHREVRAGSITYNEVIALGQKLAPRADAEQKVERVRNELPPARDTHDKSLIAEEKAIKSKIPEFYTKEKDVNFDSKAWVDDYYESKVIPYVNKVKNATNNG